MTVPVAGEVIATVRSYPDLVEAFRTVKERLGLSNKWCDDACGYADGVTDKKLGPSQTKSINALDFSMFCQIFAVQFEMKIDMDTVRKMEAAWEERVAGKVSVQKTRMGKVLLERAKPIVITELTRKAGLASVNQPGRRLVCRKGGKSRMKKLSKQQRRELASQAGKASAAKRARTAEAQGGHTREIP